MENNKQYTKEEIELWNSKIRNSVTRLDVTTTIKEIFKDYKDPTEGMTLQEKEKFQELLTEELQKLKNE